MQNVVGPTLVAMATKFGLGAEIQSPTGLFVCLFVCLLVRSLVCSFVSSHPATFRNGRRAALRASGGGGALRALFLVLFYLAALSKITVLNLTLYTGWAKKSEPQMLYFVKCWPIFKIL